MTSPFPQYIIPLLLSTLIMLILSSSCMLFSSSPLMYTSHAHYARRISSPISRYQENRGISEPHNTHLATLLLATYVTWLFKTLVLSAVHCNENQDHNLQRPQMCEVLLLAHFSLKSLSPSHTLLLNLGKFWLIWKSHPMHKPVPFIYLQTVILLHSNIIIS